MTTRTVSPERLVQLVDRQDILDCLTRVQRGADRFDRELFLSGFHTDAAIDAGGGASRAPGETFDKVATSGQGLAGLHYVLNHSCEIEGDAAHCETYLLFAGRDPDINRIAGGRYIDRLERRGDAWKIAFRYTILEWSGTVTPRPIAFADVPDGRLNGAPTRDGDDVSYRRPLVDRRLT